MAAVVGLLLSVSQVSQIAARSISLSSISDITEGALLLRDRGLNTMMLTLGELSLTVRPTDSFGKKESSS